MSNKIVVVVCPHCEEYIVIQEFNCNIFRHGVFKVTGEQVPPHASKEECDKYVLHLFSFKTPILNEIYIIFH